MLKYVELAGRELGSARDKIVCFSAPLDEQTEKKYTLHEQVKQ
jgi:hypothetical protein